VRRKADRTGTAIPDRLRLSNALRMWAGVSAGQPTKTHAAFDHYELVWFLKAKRTQVPLRDNAVTSGTNADERGRPGSPFTAISGAAGPPRPARETRPASPRVVDEIKSTQLRGHGGDRHGTSQRAGQDGRLLPCHSVFQFYVADVRVVMPTLPAASADAAARRPFNIASSHCSHPLSPINALWGVVISCDRRRFAICT